MNKIKDGKQIEDKRSLNNNSQQSQNKKLNGFKHQYDQKGMKYGSRKGSKTQANTSPDLQMRNLNDNHLQFFNEKLNQNTTPFKMRREGSINKETQKLNNIKAPNSQQNHQVSKMQYEQTQYADEQEYTNSGNLIDVQDRQKRIQKILQNHQNLKRQIVNEQTTNEDQQIIITDQNRRQSDLKKERKEESKRNGSIKDERIYEDMQMGKAGNISSSNSSFRIAEKTRTLNRNLNMLEYHENYLLTSHPSKYKNQNHQKFQNNSSISQNNHHLFQNQAFFEQNHIYHNLDQKPETTMYRISQNESEDNNRNQ